MSRNCRKYRFPTTTIGVASTVFLLAGPPAAAESTPGCLHHPAKLSDAAVDGFEGRPSAFLDRHPTGGVLMSAAVRRLAGSNISTVPVLISLVRQAKVPQIVAIGVGLARTVTVCKRLRPDLAQRIKEEVERAAIPALSTAFLAGLSLDQVAAMGGPDAAGLPGKRPTAEPEVPKAAEDFGAKSLVGGPPYRGSPSESAFPLSFFGNGGVTQTVTRPVSPAR
jgi:hypothetical protein